MYNETNYNNKINTYEIIEETNTYSLPPSIDEFKNKILNDITSYINSSKVINGSNFQAVILSSDDMNPEVQIKNGISAVDLSNCTNVIKEYYNITKEENLIILNMEIKNEQNENEGNSFIIEKNTQLEIYDILGRKLNLSVCKEDIKIMKYIGDVIELDINSALAYSEKGIDVFNASDAFFNDICSFYDSSDGKDIIIDDRRNDIYQNVTFCQYGCTYNGMNYNLMVADCICKTTIIQEEEKNNTKNNEEKEFINFKSISKVFLENLFNFDFQVLRCYNLVINIKILFHNIGFYCLFSMFLLQILFAILFLIKGMNDLKYFLLKFENKNLNKKKKRKKKIKIINNKISKNKNNKMSSSKKLLSTPLRKTKRIKNSSNNLNKEIKNEIDKKQENIIDNNNDINENGKIHKRNEIIIPEISDKSEVAFNKLNLKSSTKFKEIKNLSISNDLDNNNHIQNIYNKNSSGESNNYNNNIDQIKSIKEKDISIININNNHNIHNIELDKKNENHYIKEYNIFYQTIYYLQEMDYNEAILYDKRGYLSIYWGFLVDSQIILGTFCIDNHLDIFAIKLSFLVFIFQISFFLNALFYTDEYISEAYHNEGVLDFFSGLPKSIYSFIATLITTNLLRMLSSSKSELINILKDKRNFRFFIDIISLKLNKLRKKLIIYFILVYIFTFFFCIMYLHFVQFIEILKNIGS